MTVSEYIAKVDKHYQSGISSEHTYRGDLENLIRELVKDVEITNEPSKVTNCGNPDYVITKGKIPVGYIEAKDVGKDLKSKQYNEQFTRYKRALDNLIITDYLWFRFYKEGDLVHEIRIGEIEDNKITPLPENFTNFINLLADFCTYVGQTIRSSKKLAVMMAAKARLLQNIVERALLSDEESAENSSLNDQYESFKNILIHDLTPKAFADIYAQTLAYGMFAARLHDQTPNDFSRYEAAELIPKTNPFLKKLFTYIAGPGIDERIKRTVDNLALVFRAVNLDALLHNFGRSTQTRDPIIHFYETFLAEYDAKLRKTRGVWYTPEPVVNFIVRAVDDILKSEFDLPMGLADTSKTKIKVKTQTKDKRTASGYKVVEQEVHKVQILDPATGTGTFLAEVIKFIYTKQFKAMQGAWSSYVDEHLIPRLNGFELLMASYSMAHLKLDMLLTETGYKATKSQRFNIYLTNSLEEYHPDTGTIFSRWLSTEANEANHIKRDTPVMCVIGNPPYSGESANKGKWIMKLMEDYKKEPGGKEKLKERNLKWLNDDYVKFIRFAQYLINKNGEGILAFINPHGFLDAPTFRGLRWQLLNLFDKVHIIDLHGNSRKKEKCLDGSPDENVFDIIQGVSINIFVKKNSSNTNKKPLLHYDLYGKRKDKYEFLSTNSIETINWNKIEPQNKEYYFVPKDYSLKAKYETGLSVNSLFNINGVGICSKRDAIAFQPSKAKIREVINDFYELTEAELKSKYSIKKESRDQKVSYAKDNIRSFGLDDKYFTKCLYRPFDERWTYYTNQVRGFLAYPVFQIMQHFTTGENIGLCFVKAGRNEDYQNYFVINKIVTKDAISSLDSINTFPLYLYPEESGQRNFYEKMRIPNLNPNLVEQIAQAINLTFTPEKDTSTSPGVISSFAPIDILDYIYAVLHSPNYREKYKEFLKIDFPRVPYPKSSENFWQLVELGKQIRQIHLLESPKVEEYITSYPVGGSNVVEKPVFKIFPPGPQGGVVGKVHINNTQYFDNVPELAWNFYIGGYQPAQKWLKDRRGRPLTFEDIIHYQKIIVALTETDRLMKEIDVVGVE